MSTREQREKEFRLALEAQEWAKCEELARKAKSDTERSLYMHDTRHNRRLVEAPRENFRTALIGIGRAMGRLQYVIEMCIDAQDPKSKYTGLDLYGALYGVELMIEDTRDKLRDSAIERWGLKSHEQKGSQR